MKPLLPICLASAAAALVALPATATTVASGSDFRLAPTQTAPTDLSGAVRRAVALNPASQPAKSARNSRAHPLPRAFDDLPDTNLNYSRKGGPAIELGVLGSEIGAPKGVVHFALAWDF